jgi:two-component system, OmpR family, alkaline phosphatase synthesis response regulator PhoP
MKPLVFVVEDEQTLRELYQYSLEGEFEVGCFEDGGELFAALGQRRPDLFLLDIMLPGEDGYTILERLKKGGFAEIPVIIVSAKGEELSKVKGLNLGADDYIAKPFGILELIARIKANLRKGGKTTASRVEYKDIVIDGARHSITVAGKPLEVTLKEYNLLLLLCREAEKVQLREDIFLHVWGSDFVGETRTLDMHIKELRRKLKEAGSLSEIATIRSVGYMLR